MDCITLCANPCIIWLQVETAVEIQGGATAVHLRPDPCAVPQQEVDRRGARKHGARNAVRVDALRALLLLPLKTLGGMRPYRNAEDHFVMDDYAPNRWLGILLPSQA